jgi:hypothetical protein
MVVAFRCKQTAGSLALLGMTNTLKFWLCYCFNATARPSRMGKIVV